MKPKTPLTIAILFFFVAATVACASTQNQSQSFRATASGFSFDLGQKEVNISLDATINGWSVSCDRTRAVVWGRAWDQLKLGDAPYSRAYVIDLPHAKIISEFTVSRGPFEVVYSSDQNLTSVDDYVIDKASGEIVGMTDDFKLIAESCTSFPGKQSD